MTTNYFDGADRAMNDRLKKGVTDALQIAVATIETIREVREIPAGKLYAVLMTRMDHETFSRLLQTILNTGLVAKSPAGMLRWVGPEVTR